MKRTFRQLMGSVVLMLTAVVLFAFAAPQDQKAGGAWVIPAKYKTMKNTAKGNAELDKVGKLLYTKHCKSCHGATGLGDGPKAASMKTKINSLKDAKFQAQTDGEIYYQSFVGRDEMPNFEKKIVEEDERWAIVNFMRTFK